MAWKIEFSAEAEKELSQLDKPIIKRILKFLLERVAPLDNPRLLGEALRGNELGKYWKYRIGNYRLICAIQDDKVRILVMRIGHRKSVYR
jgi:mRNA interferase RelE/StbE